MSRKTRSSVKSSHSEEVKKRKLAGEEKNTLSELSDFFDSDSESREEAYNTAKLKMREKRRKMAEEREKDQLLDKHVSLYWQLLEEKHK